MNIKIIHRFFILALLILFTNSCVEPFDADSETFESVIVIEATLTNEIKKQEVKLSKVSKLEEDGVIAEGSATVSITDNFQNKYNFNETDDGIYSSNEEFAAQPDFSYTLLVTTTEGKSYISEPTKLQVKNTDEIEALYAERVNNDDNQEGISVFIDNTSLEAEAQYYRYEYIETYKFISPFWTANDLVEAPEGSSQLVLVPKEKEEEICYRTNKSKSIILANTNAFSENRINRFPIRFIEKNSYISANRYSILIKQFVSSFEAYTFFETLRDFSGSESLFSENQPGFFEGNIVSKTNPDEKVVGFFDVASVSQKRIFFEYKDFFPEEPLPDFVSECLFSAPRYDVLVDQIRSGGIKYFSENTNPKPMEGPYLVVADLCGDCTIFGSNTVPEFWEE